MAGKAHHTVQRFHIAQFVGHDPKGHVWIYDNRMGVPRSAVPDNVSVENNFHSFERKDGTWDNVLDDWIKKLEGKATPVDMKLLGGKIPPLWLLGVFRPGWSLRDCGGLARDDFVCRPLDRGALWPACLGAAT
jgi:hypothetical protein